MDLLNTIKYIYPNFLDLEDYMVVDNWNWPEIQWYNTEITQPTQAELETAWAEVQIEMEIKSKMKRLDEINEKVLRLWWTNILKDIPEFEAKRLATIDTLTTEAEEIKTFLIAQDKNDFIWTLIDSIFS